MKKLVSMLLAVAMVLSVGVTSAFAQTSTVGAGFVDTDGDGICDNAIRNGARPQNGTGRQLRHGGAGCGANFIDADGDGICDNAGNGAQIRNRGAQRGGRGNRSK